MNFASTNWLLWGLIIAAVVVGWTWIHSSKRRQAPLTLDRGYRTLQSNVRGANANDGMQPNQKHQRSHHGCC